jgi:hypothetical protein
MNGDTLIGVYANSELAPHSRRQLEDLHEHDRNCRGLLLERGDHSGGVPRIASGVIATSSEA